MEKCKCDINDKCQLLDSFRINVKTTGKWCVRACMPNNPAAQMKMLTDKFKIVVPDIPEDREPIDWIKQCQDDGTIVVTEKGILQSFQDLSAGKFKNQPATQNKVNKDCSGCGKAKNILKGFASLAELKLKNNEPPEFAQKRIEICLECDDRTWLNPIKWGIGFIQKGDLPVNHTIKHLYVLWCSKCKCCITAKALVEGEICPMEKWDKL